MNVLHVPQLMGVHSSICMFQFIDGGQIFNIFMDLSTFLSVAEGSKLISQYIYAFVFHIERTTTFGILVDMFKRKTLEIVTSK